MPTKTRTLAEVAAAFKTCGHTPEGARGSCVTESARFVQALAKAGIEAKSIAGFTWMTYEGHRVIMNGHTAVLVGTDVYDWTARQFYPHDQPVPMVTPLWAWRDEWPDLTY